MENRRPLGLGSATTKTPSRRGALNHKNTLNDKNTSYYSKDMNMDNNNRRSSTKKSKNNPNPNPFDFDFALSDGDSEDENDGGEEEDEESGEERGEEWENAYSRVLNPNTSTKSTHSPTKSARTTSANTSPSKHSKIPTGKSTSTTKRVDFAALARQRQRRSTGGGVGGVGGGATPRPRPSVSASEARFDFPRYAHLSQDDDGMDVDRDFGAGAEERGKQGESETAREIHGVQQRLQLISPPPEEVIVRSRSARLSGQFTPAKAGLLVGTGANPNNASNGASGGGASASAKGTKSTQEVKGAKRKRPRPSQPRARVSVEAGVDAAQVEGEGEQAEEEGETHEAEPEEQVEATPNPKPRKVARGRALGRERVDLEESPTRGSRGRGARAEEEGEMDVDVEGAEDYVMRSVGKRKGGEKESQRGGGEREEKENATPTRARRVLVQSPYARNPDADWIAPLSLSAVEGPARRAVLGARSARRSMTPIPHYEPPPDVFTPPRVVFATPVPPSGKGRSKSERKPRTGLRVVTTPVAVKQEIPDDIDLSAPMPPPSPTDDPLLLSGPPSEGNSSSPARMRVDGRRFRVPEVPVRRVREAEEAHIPIAEEFAPLQDQEDDDDGVLPPSSPERPLAEDSMMRVDPADAEVSPVRLFEGGGWSDSEEERTPARLPMELMEEGEGEYTGRWRMLRVRTKQDPPSSATKMRMDAWGRPVSPFPRHRGVDEDSEEEREVRQMSVEFSDEEAADEAPEPVSVLPIQHEDEDAPMQGAAELDQDAPLNNDSEDDDDASTDTDFDPSLVKITSADPRAAARAAAILKQHDYDCYTKMVLKKRVADAKARRATLAASGADLARESRRRDLASAGIAKPSSSNHTANPKGRRTTLGAGMGVIGEQVFIPGSPVVTLPQLLQDAEVEVRGEMSGAQSPSKAWAARAAVQGRDAYKTPAPRRSLPFTLPSVTNARPFSPASKHTPASATCSPFHLPLLSTDIAPNGERKWSKDAWRALDACFTDLRLEHGAAAREQERDDGGAEMAPVDAMRIEDVVERFLDLVRESAGHAQEVDMDKWGGAWSRDTLIERARALIKKQREGRGARPLTTPRVSLSGTPVGVGKAFDFSFATPAPRSQDAVSEEDTTPELRIEVPDFTPLPMGRRGVAHPRARALSRKASASRAEEVSDAVEMEVASSVARQRQSPRPPPVAPRAPFAALSMDEEDQRRASAPRLSLLKAPRYSHLLEEAVRVSLGVPEPTNKEQEEGESFEGEESFEDSYGQESFEDEQEVEDEQDDANTTTTAPENANATLGTRVKGFLFSYLRPSSKAASSALPQRNPLQPRKPGLPLPPRAILDKPRGPVRTPARLPVVRPVPPRELVRLHPAPSTSASTTSKSKSAIPRRAPPKRLVELHHAPPPVEQPLVKLGGTMPRPRRSSGSSVRDLVKGFEALDREQKGVMEGVKRMRSVGELRKEWRAAGGDTRPRWKF